MAGASVIGSNHLEAGVDEARDEVMPLPPCLREPVKKHDHALALARGDVVETQARLDIGHAVCATRQVQVMGHGQHPLWGS
jgi:hypothetical protein